LKIRPYANKIKEVIEPIAEAMEDLSFNPYFQKRELEKVLVVPVTSDKGLCGSFNSAVIREAESVIKQYEANVDVLCIGKKGHDFFRKSKKNYQLLEAHVDMAGDSSFERINKIAEKVLQGFVSEEYDEVRDRV
jgi:F-type H+-transporting ATPase subunit gamma